MVRFIRSNNFVCIISHFISQSVIGELRTSKPMVYEWDSKHSRWWSFMFYAIFYCSILLWPVRTHMIVVNSLRHQQLTAMYSYIACVCVMCICIPACNGMLQMTTERNRWTIILSWKQANAVWSTRFCFRPHLVFLICRALYIKTATIFRRQNKNRRNITKCHRIHI